MPGLHKCKNPPHMIMNQRPAPHSYLNLKVIPIFAGDVAETDAGKDSAEAAAGPADTAAAAAKLEAINVRMPLSDLRTLAQLADIKAGCCVAILRCGACLWAQSKLLLSNPPLFSNIHVLEVVASYTGICENLSEGPFPPR